MVMQVKIDVPRSSNTALDMNQSQSSYSEAYAAKRVPATDTHK